MGKTNKKRKFIKKVSRKQKKPIPKFVYPQQPELQRLWDENKTLKQNFKAIGLAVNPNTSKSLKPKRGGIQEGDRILGTPEEEEVPQLLEVPEAAPPIEKRISRAKIDYYMPLIRKYGSDYEKMFRDIKLNFEQQTAKQLKKNCEWLIEKLAHQETQLLAEERQQKKQKTTKAPKKSDTAEDSIELPEDFPQLADPDAENANGQEEGSGSEEEEEEDGKE